MLKNKLRKRLGNVRGCRNDRSTPDSNLLAAEENGVKGCFLYVFKQEVRTKLWFQHCDADGPSLPTVAPEAQMVLRQYPDKSKHCLVTSSNTVRPLVELHGTCYSISNTIIWAKAKNKKYNIWLIHWWHGHIMAKNSNLLPTCTAQFLHLIGITT